jgi:hypothetical protein
MFSSMLSALVSLGVGRAYVPAGVTVSLGANHVISGKVIIDGPGVILDTRTSPTNELFTIGPAASGTQISCRLYGSVAGTYVQNHHAIVIQGTDNGAGVAPTYVTGVTVDSPEVKGFGSLAVFGEFVSDARVDIAEAHHLGYGGTILHSALNVTSHIRLLHDISPGTSSESYGIQFDRRDSQTDLVEFPRSINCEARIDTAWACPNIHALGTHGGQGCRFSWGAMYGVGRPLDIVGATGTGHVAMYAPHDCSFEGGYADSGITNGTGGTAVNLAGAFKTTDTLGSPTEYATGITGRVGILRGYGIESDSTSGAVYAHSTQGLDIDLGWVQEASPYALNLYHDNKDFTVRGVKAMDPWTNTGALAGIISVASTYNTGRILAASSTPGAKSATHVNNRGLNVTVDASNVIKLGPNADFSGASTPTAGPVILASTFTDPVLAANGAAATPSLSFSGDTTTGFYKVANGQLGVTVSSTLVWRFLSGGPLLADGQNFSVGTSTGSIIAAGASQKLGFWGKTPVVQPSGTAAAATDLATALTLVNDLRAKLLSVGIIA